ncbi:hypothetical protein ACFVS2_25235 [Brevibacillus sp. NPDC058079]|uniref:hypothetical protein n=1 Tax=Brevibacillus sp. NPDC058079 TaxID=3346330 RepID=UPI0036E449C5
MERLTPEQAAERIATEDHISIVFEDGFEEGSQTAKEFKYNVYNECNFDEICVGALLGGRFIYENFLNHLDLLKNAIVDIVKYGDWSYIILHDHKHPTDSRLHVGIENINKVEGQDEESASPQYEEIHLRLNQKESYTVLSIVDGNINEGRTDSDYDVERLKELFKAIENPFGEFEEGLEFEVQIMVRRKK